MIGRYDASYGTVLKGSNKKIFAFVPPLASGFIVDGDVKSMAIIPAANGGKLLVVAANSDSLQVFRLNHSTKIRQVDNK
jgi:hypothetical protein